MKRERGVRKKEEKGKGKERMNAMADLLDSAERKNVPLPGFERHSSILEEGNEREKGRKAEDRDESLGCL